MSTEKYTCSGGEKLIFACSGAADVGEISDLAARQLTREGVAKMFCMAGIGGKISPILKTTQAASTILAIDGCPLGCVKSSLKLAGFKNFHHIQLGELNLEKGSSPATRENIAKVTARATKLLSECNNS